LGKGTHGTVYLAMQTDDGLLIATKQLEFRPLPRQSDERARTVDWTRPFAAEMLSRKNNLLELDHDHIVRYLRFTETSDSLDILQEYVAGGSIGNLIQNYGSFEAPLPRNFTRQILGGLTFLHSQGIVHGNLKSHNVLVTNKGSCKISDVGFSQCSDSLGNDDEKTFFLQTSVFWMPPEVVVSGQLGTRSNVKIDIWSVGCLLLEMQSGKRPWAPEDTVSVMFKLGVSKMAPSRPEGLSILEDDFLQLCFSIDPEERPTAAVLLEHGFVTGD